MVYQGIKLHRQFGELLIAGKPRQDANNKQLVVNKSYYSFSKLIVS